jgi:uncharacterized protein with HEPN domain
VGCDKDDFGNNSLIVDACVFNLSQVGELSTALDDSFTESHPEIPWAKLAGLRHRIVHDYEGIKILLIWDFIENELGGLKSQLNQIVNTTDGQLPDTRK